MHELKSLRCKPLDGQPPMPAEQITAHLARVPGWALHEGAIEKTFRF